MSDGIVNYKVIIVILVIILSVILISFYFKGSQTKQKAAASTQTQQLTLISINPESLDNSTILPTQNLEFTFSQPIYRSEFKHHFDPDVPHDIEVVNGIDSEHGNIIRIRFRKPLQLGSGYTLFIESGTKVNEKLRLDRDYIYHFTTIGYRGV